MTKAKNRRGAAQSKPLNVQALKGETEAATMARVMVTPFLRHGVVGSSLADKMVGKLPGEPRFDDFSLVIQARAEAALKGDMALATQFLTAQALSLDAMFTELARRATINLGEYPQTAERYGRLALKAQSNCRATLETLVQLHQPRVQTVRHVHVNEGGQAVVTDHFHQHTRGAKNEKSSEQPHATGQLGTSTSLSGQDTLRIGLPSASSERQAAVQNARRS